MIEFITVMWYLYPFKVPVYFKCACCSRGRKIGWKFVIHKSLRRPDTLMRRQVTSLKDCGLYRVFLDFILAVVHQSCLEYYWHRLMHYKFFYTTFHKIHHYYKSPEPWDDMYIHPLEAFGYYCILYSPPFIYHIHCYSFIAYMVVMGICGVLDHSGVRISLPGIYCTVDHSFHHEKFNVNYSFPFPFMDMLHGTYYYRNPPPPPSSWYRDTVCNLRTWSLRLVECKTLCGRIWLSKTFKYERTSRGNTRIDSNSPSMQYRHCSTRKTFYRSSG